VDAALPETGLDRERERLLSAPFVADRTYGTRASYLLSITAAGSPQGDGDGPRAKVRFVERSFDREVRLSDERAFEFALEDAGA
jgi:uncharacterized protein with NRDE domain